MRVDRGEEIQNEILRKMPGWKRLKIACDLYDFARTLIRSRIRDSHHEMSDEEIERLVRERFKKWHTEKNGTPIRRKEADEH